MIEIELAYMNTNHPDFIGFDKASKRDKRSGTRAAGNQLIRKGWLSMPVSLIKGSSRDYWFVLSSDSLTWYKDDEVRGSPSAAGGWPWAHTAGPSLLCVVSIPFSALVSVPVSGEGTKVQSASGGHESAGCGGWAVLHREEARVRLVLHYWKVCGM